MQEAYLFHFMIALKKIKHVNTSKTRTESPLMTTVGATQSKRHAIIRQYLLLNRVNFRLKCMQRKKLKRLTKQVNNREQMHIIGRT